MNTNDKLKKNIFAILLKYNVMLSVLFIICAISDVENNPENIHSCLPIHKRYHHFSGFFQKKFKFEVIIDITNQRLK
jgi:hypothetical protein